MQLRRDRLTFAMMFGVPIIQLLLFGYAINTDPQHLPTAVLVGGPAAQFARSICRPLADSGYFRFDHVGRAARPRWTS